MVKTKVTLKLSTARMNVVIGGQAKAAVDRAATAAQRRAQNNVRAAGRIDTGELVNGIVKEPSQVRSDPMHPAMRVVSRAKHSLYNELGTRDHGARNGGVMRFKPKGSGTFVFARRVRGIRGIHFMRNAVQQTRVNDFL